MNPVKHIYNQMSIIRESVVSWLLTVLRARGKKYLLNRKLYEISAVDVGFFFVGYFLCIDGIFEFCKEILIPCDLKKKIIKTTCFEVLLVTTGSYSDWFK